MGLTRIRRAPSLFLNPFDIYKRDDLAKQKWFPSTGSTATIKVWLDENPERMSQQFDQLLAELQDFVLMPEWGAEVTAEELHSIER